MPAVICGSESFVLLRITGLVKHQDIIPFTRRSGMNLIQKTMKTINQLREEYTFDYGLFSDLDERLLDMKDRLESLNDADKNILLLYAEYGSLREVGKLIGVSHSSIRKYLNRIRKKLLC